MRIKRDFLLKPEPLRKRLKTMAFNIARQHGIGIKDILGTSRRRPIVIARHEFFWMAMQITTTYKLQRALGWDHRTLALGAKRHESRLSTSILSYPHFSIVRSPRQRAA